MAYVLGFFFADGSHDVNPRGSEYFSFQICDRDLLDCIRTVLSSEHKIAVRRPRSSKESTLYRLQIGSKEMCNDLRSHGVLSAKSQVMAFPHVPKAFVSAFIRGYFDGDGNIWTGEIHKLRKTRHKVLLLGFTSSSKIFLGGLHRKLRSLGVSGGGVYCKRNAFCLKYSTSDSLKAYRVMYSGLGESKLFLPRKKQVFEEYLQNCGGSSIG